MNTKRLAVAVITLLLTAGFTIAQETDKTAQRKSKMAQIEKDAVGMWQRVGKYIGHTIYIPEFKVYNENHEWYSFRTNMEKPGIFAGGTWEVVSPDSIVEHNDYSIDPAYDGNVDVYLKINTFKPNFHGISFVPRGYNQVVFMDYEKVEKKSAGSRGLFMGRDEIHFNTMKDYPHVGNSIRFFKNHDDLSEQITLAQMPAKTKDILQSIASRLLINKTCNMILHIALTEDGKLAICTPKSLFQRIGSCFICVYHEDEYAEAAEILYKQVNAMPQQQISPDATFYTVDIPVNVTQDNSTNLGSRLDLEKGISL